MLPILYVIILHLRREDVIAIFHNPHAILTLYNTKKSAFSHFRIIYVLTYKLTW